MRKRKVDDADARDDVNTPKPSKSSTRVPSTPSKKPRSKQSAQDKDLSSVARSLTPLFNGFKAARDRASQLGGRYVVKTRKPNLGLNSGSRGGKVGKVGKVGKDKPGSAVSSIKSKRGERRTTTEGPLSVHTGDVKREVRVLRFDTMAQPGAPGRTPENLR
jgi:hypothetical protein